MMVRKCWECGGELKVLDANRADGVLVECENCRVMDEIGCDGLDARVLEKIETKIRDMEHKIEI